DGSKLPSQKWWQATALQITYPRAYQGLRTTSMAEERHSPAFILRTAERSLSEQWRGAVRLSVGRAFPSSLARKSLVLRCHVTEAPSGAPETVIVKKAAEHQAPYEPDHPGRPNAAHGLLDDWAALQFLCQLGSDPALAPRLYGGD